MFFQNFDKSTLFLVDHYLFLQNFFFFSSDLATDEVDHLFAASDDDHDNRLSFEEILEHHDTFVGSEATDYGDYLQDIERFADEL